MNDAAAKEMREIGPAKATKDAVPESANDAVATAEAAAREKYGAPRIGVVFFYAVAT